MKLSIIICVYNTPAELFEACLRSIAESTLSRGASQDPVEYEICVVDDGSSIDYSELVTKYGLNYVKTGNMGIFSARLTGISMARGEYIVFVDSDDTVSWNYHRPMLEAAQRGGLDIVINDWAFHTERTRYCCRNDTTLCTDMSLEGDEVLRAFLSQSGLQHSFFVLWNKLYSARILQFVARELSELAKSVERFNYSEDALMNFYAFLSAKKVKNVHTGYYFYRIHSSQSVAVVSEDRLKKQIDCMTYTLDRMERETASLASSAEFAQYIGAWRRLMSRSHYSHAKSNGYTGLYGYIKEKYKVENLQKAKNSDGRYYAECRPLPDNIDEIDAVLYSAYRNELQIQFDSDYGDGYVKRQLRALSDSGCRVSLKKGGAEIPKPVIRLKNRVIMNSFVRKVGMLLFPKGSKIRAFLKKKM